MAEWTPDQQKEHRKLWVEALRSGKYQQGTEVLRGAAGEMCCLGIACDISGLVTWGALQGSTKGRQGFVPIIDGDHFGNAYTPPAVQCWLGLTDDAGSFRQPGDKTALAWLNDHGKTFAEIADIIEAEPAGLIATSEPA